MKNTGHTTQNTLISSVCMGLNIVLNAVLIFGLLGLPSMGVQGAALATTISMAVQLLWSIGASLGKDNIRLKPQFLLHSNPVLRKDFVKYSLPIAGNYFFWGIGTTFYSVIIGHLGSEAVAANSIVNIAKNLITCTSKGFSTASGIVIGNELGSNQLEKAKVHAKRLALFSGICGTISGVIILILRPVLLCSITQSETAMGYMSDMLLICSYYVIFGAIDSTVIGGVFCAGGKSKFGLCADAIVIWLIVVPSAAIAAFVIKAPVLVVYFILHLDEVIKIPAVYRYFTRYSWVNNITR